MSDDQPSPFSASTDAVDSPNWPAMLLTVSPAATVYDTGPAVVVERTIEAAVDLMAVFAAAMASRMVLPSSTADGRCLSAGRASAGETGPVRLSVRAIEPTSSTEPVEKTVWVALVRREDRRRSGAILAWVAGASPAKTLLAASSMESGFPVIVLSPPPRPREHAGHSLTVALPTRWHRWLLLSTTVTDVKPIYMLETLRSEVCLRKFTCGRGRLGG